MVYDMNTGMLQPDRLQQAKSFPAKQKIRTSSNRLFDRLSSVNPSFLPDRLFALTG
jgi:hypothetical protein